MSIRLRASVALVPPHTQRGRDPAVAALLHPRLNLGPRLTFMHDRRVPCLLLAARRFDYTSSFVPITCDCSRARLTFVMPAGLRQSVYGGRDLDEEGGFQRECGGVTGADGDAFISDCESIEFHTVQCCELVMPEL